MRRLVVVVAASQGLAVGHQKVSETLLRACCQQDQQLHQHVQSGEHVQFAGQGCEPPADLPAAGRYYESCTVSAVSPPQRTRALMCRHRRCWLGQSRPARQVPRLRFSAPSRGNVLSNSALFHGCVGAKSFAGVDLARTADAQTLLMHFTPVSDPARHAANGEQHGEHVHRNADCP